MMLKIQQFSNILKDKELREEVIELVKEKKKSNSSSRGFGLTNTNIESELKEHINSVEQHDTLIKPPSLLLETIVLAHGRPVLFIRNDDFDNSDSPKINKHLSAARPYIKVVIPVIGRVEVENHPDFTWLGTAYLIRKNILITNRHVAKEFAEKKGNHFVYLINEEGDKMQSYINFKSEFQIPDQSRWEISEIIYIEPDPNSESDLSKPDLAFLLLKNEIKDHNPVKLAKDLAKEKDFLVTIGYPARDPRIPDINEMERVFGNVYDVKRLAPGQIITNDGNIIKHDCSTLGGNSGSALINENGEAIGLHFSGKYHTENYAISASVIQSKLDELKI
jgi:endonuclease G